MWCHGSSNQDCVLPDMAGQLVSSGMSTVGNASDITIPSWTLNNADLCPVDTRRGKKKRRIKCRGRRWSNPLCDHSSNSQLFHLTSASTVMCSAPYNLYSVCALPPNSTKYYGPLIKWISLLLLYLSRDSSSDLWVDTSSPNGSPEQLFRGNALILQSRLLWVSCRTLFTLLLGATHNSGKLAVGVVCGHVTLWERCFMTGIFTFFVFTSHPRPAQSLFLVLKTLLKPMWAKSWPICVALEGALTPFTWLDDWMENLRNQPCPGNIMAFCWRIC